MASTSVSKYFPFFKVIITLWITIGNSPKFQVHLNSLLSHTCTYEIFELIDKCTPGKFLIWKPCARLCADGTAVVPGRPCK